MAGQETTPANANTGEKPRAFDAEGSIGKQFTGMFSLPRPPRNSPVELVTDKTSQRTEQSEARRKRSVGHLIKTVPLANSSRRMGPLVVRCRIPWAGRKAPEGNEDKVEGIDQSVYRAVRESFLGH
jgi:hypothetical protein